MENEKIPEAWYFNRTDQEVGKFRVRILTSSLRQMFPKKLSFTLSSNIPGRMSMNDGHEYPINPFRRGTNYAGTFPHPLAKGDFAVAILALTLYEEVEVVLIRKNWDSWTRFADSFKLIILDSGEIGLQYIKDSRCYVNPRENERGEVHLNRLTLPKYPMPPEEILSLDRFLTMCYPQNPKDSGLELKIIATELSELGQEHNSSSLVARWRARALGRLATTHSI